VAADGIAQFFKGVATVCTKLFNAVEVRSHYTPTLLYANHTDTASPTMRISDRKISSKLSYYGSVRFLFYQSLRTCALSFLLVYLNLLSGKQLINSAEGPSHLTSHS
jgi:hypothetical protein